MKNRSVLLAVVAASVFTAGCSTTSGGAQYKASTQNVLHMQEHLENAKVRLLGFTAAAGVDDSHWCRAVGPLTIGGGKTPTQFIHDAMQEELFLAQSYSRTAPIAISGRVDALSFSSVSPAKWEITLSLTSSNGASYQVKGQHEFSTSWGAVEACKNTADAFVPAVQDVLKRAVSDARFKSLIAKPS